MLTRFEIGINTMKKIGDNIPEHIIKLFSDIAPDFSTFLIENFGDIFSRPILNMREREMITIASLITLGHSPDRLKTHICGALNVGVTPREIVEIIMQMALYVGFPAAVDAMLVAKDVLEEEAIITS